MFYIIDKESKNYHVFIDGMLKEFERECDVPILFNTREDALQNIRDMYISIGYDADTLNDKRSWFQRCVDVCFIKQKHYTEYL